MRNGSQETRSALPRASARSRVDCGESTRVNQLTRLEGIRVAEQPLASQRLADAYKRLVASSETHRSATHKFSKPVAEIEWAIKHLNLPVVTWQKIAGGEDNYGGYWSRDVGYARTRGLWGLAVRSVRGHSSWDEDEIEQWPFDEAPSSLRLEALDKLPDLLEEIVKNADKTTKKLEQRTPDAVDLARAIKEASAELRVEKDHLKGRRK
jgi:hypothetical protein